MAGQHHQCNEHELEQILGDGEGQGGFGGWLQSMVSQRAGHDWVTEQQQQTPLTSSYSFHFHPHHSFHSFIPCLDHCSILQASLPDLLQFIHLKKKKKLVGLP